VNERNLNLNHRPDAHGRRPEAQNKSKTDPQKYFDVNFENQKLKEVVNHYKKDQIAFQGFLVSIFRYWHALTPIQKIMTGFIVAAVIGCSTYFIFQFIMRADVTLPSNRLSLEEQHQMNSRIKQKIRFEPQFWKRAQSMPAFQDPQQKIQFQNEQNSYIKDLKTFKKTVEDNLSAGMVMTKIQADTLSQDDFTIDITHRNGAGKNAVAGFVHDTHPQILFAEGPQLTKSQFTSWYLNEIHHGAISWWNRKLGCSIKNTLLDAEAYCISGNWNTSYSTKLHQTIKDGLIKIKKLHELSEKKLWLTKEESNFYQQGLDALKNYHSYIDSQRLPKKGFMKLKPDLEPAPRSSGYDYIIPQPISQEQYGFPIYSDVYVKILREEGNEIELRFQFGNNDSPHETISALLTAIQIHSSAAFAKNGPYGQKHLEYPTQVAELASFIDSLPVATLQYFFPTFCDYFSEYFRVNYCDHDDPPAYRRS
jgi:hypothetical protein